MVDSREETLTQEVIDYMIENEGEDGIRATLLAEKLNIDITRLRTELNALESLGLVFRTGSKRGTRWWVG